MRKLLFVVLTSCLLASCTKDDNGEENKNITVVNESQLSQAVFADKMTGTSGVHFTTTGAWTSSITEKRATLENGSSPNWVSINPASGEKSGDYTVNITLATNFTGEKRTATININCNGSIITITVTQEAKTESGEVPKEPTGSGTLKNETTGKSISLVGVEHSISGPEYVRIEFVGEKQIVDGKEQTDRFIADFYNPLQDGRLKSGTYTIKNINAYPAPEMKNGDCGWYKSSLGNYAKEGTITVDYNGSECTFVVDLNTQVDNERIKGSFTGVPKYLNSEVKVTSVTLNETQKTLEFGGSFTLNATIVPENATDKRYTWSSGNTAVATVDENGTVKAVTAGKTVITATSKEGTKTATCEVTVSAAIAVQSIKVEPTEITLLKGDRYEQPLTVTVLPENATNQAFEWKSEDSNVATYDGKSIVGNSVGTTFITFTTKDGSKIAKLKVTVNARSSSGNGTVKVTDDSGKQEDQHFNLAEAKHTVVTKNKIELSLRDDSDNHVLELRFTNPLVGGRLAAGNYTASSNESTTNNTVYQYSSYRDMGYLKSGVVTVSVIGDNYTIEMTNIPTTNGKKVTCSYIGKCTYTNEYLEVTSVQLDKSTLSLDFGKSAQLTATVNPTNAFTKNVTWSSSNSNIVSVDGNGYLYASGLGTATITVTTEDGAKTATCTVTVNALPATGNGTFSNTSGQSIAIKRAKQVINSKEPKEIGLTFYSESSVYGDLSFTLIRASTDNGALKAGTYSVVSSLNADKLGVKYSYTNTGTVTVAVTGTQYTVTLNITSEDGVKITGSYSGTLPEIDM